MIKNNLPVILLKGLVLLPLEDARIELNNDITKKIIDISKLYHNNEILVVTPLNDLEEQPDTGDLPKIGVRAKITSRIDLPNGNTRIVLRGEKRVRVLSYVNYSNEKDILESIIVSTPSEEYNEVEETALLRKLIAELDRYIGLNPYISNSILNQIKGITDLDKLTDSVANFLPLNFEKKISFMLDTFRTSRAKRLITEINIELAVLELEQKIELDLKKNIDDMQKDMILREKIKVIREELGEKDSKREYIDNVKEKIQNGVFPVHIKKRIEQELGRLELMTDNSPELGVLRTYVDYLVSIPWGIYGNTEKNLNVIESHLNKSHYGLNKVKTRILEYIAVKKNEFTGPVICLIGPPGVGKTTLASSIASALKKNFVKVSLGGINDPAELIGHRRTYIGSAPGKIVTSIIKSRCMDPVILLDEIDKMSKDYKGDPANVLLDLLDNSQNHMFTDNYIEEVIDLSNVTFIITANDVDEIPYVLLDRLEVIYIESYLNYEKLNIAKDYLIPDAKVKNGIKNVNVNFSDKAILKVINDYTKESGVRELSRLINRIIRKDITSYKLKNEKLSLINVTENNLVNYLGIEKYRRNYDKINKPGFVRGLAYTPYGGEVLNLEVASYEGDKDFISSGSLGEVLKESIKIALSYIKANSEKLKIDTRFFDKTIHLNFREGSVPKDGPSAGSLIVSAILSHLLNKKVPENISMTGEITLFGDILPVGGLREKATAALREGINKIYVSIDNKRDITELDDEIKNNIKFIYVTNYIEIYNELFEKGDKK